MLHNASHVGFTSKVLSLRSSFSLLQSCCFLCITFHDERAPNFNPSWCLGIILYTFFLILLLTHSYFSILDQLTLKYFLIYISSCKVWTCWLKGMLLLFETSDRPIRIRYEYKLRTIVSVIFMLHEIITSTAVVYITSCRLFETDGNLEIVNKLVVVWIKGEL